MATKSKKKKKKIDAGRVSVVVIVIAFAIVMTIQIVKLQQKDAKYAAIEQEKLQELEDESKRAEELTQMEEDMQSENFIIEMAHRIGLVFDNETLYKEVEQQ